MKQKIMIDGTSNINTEIVHSKSSIESFVRRQQTIMDKLKILTDAAKYNAVMKALGFIKKNIKSILALPEPHLLLIFPLLLVL